MKNILKWIFVIYLMVGNVIMIAYLAFTGGSIRYMICYLGLEMVNIFCAKMLFDYNFFK